MYEDRTQNNDPEIQTISQHDTPFLLPRPGSHLGLHSQLDLAPERPESRLVTTS